MCFPFRVQSYVIRREWCLISELLLLYCFAPRVCDLSGRSLPCFATGQCHPLAHLSTSTYAMCNLASHHAYGRVCKHLGDPAIHPGDVSTFMPSATAAQQATTSPPTTSQCHWVIPAVPSVWRMGPNSRSPESMYTSLTLICTTAVANANILSSVVISQCDCLPVPLLSYLLVPCECKRGGRAYRSAPGPRDSPAICPSTLKH